MSYRVCVLQYGVLWMKPAISMHCIFKRKEVGMNLVLRDESRSTVVQVTKRYWWIYLSIKTASQYPIASPTNFKALQ